MSSLFDYLQLPVALPPDGQTPAADPAAPAHTADPAVEGTPGRRVVADRARVDERGVPAWAVDDTEPPPAPARFGGRHPDPEALLHTLNPQQRDAVVHEGSPLLIV